MAYLGQGPFQEFTNPPTKDSFTGDGSTTTFDMAATVPSSAQNALEVYVDNVRQEPGTGKAFTLGPDGSNDMKRITFSAAPANGASIYVINDKTNTSVLAPLQNDLNGTELILDGDGDTSITADSDDRIDFKIGGTDHFHITSSSSDTVFQNKVDAKDFKFNQYDGRTILEVNDAGYVALANGATGSGELRIYEDTDNGTNYTSFKVGTQSADIEYTLPTADGSSGQALVTNGSGVLSFATAGAITSYTNSTNNRIVTSVDSSTVNSEANLTFDGSALQVTGTLTVGADDTGHDVIFYGATASANMTWDESVDDLILNGAARIVIPDGQLVLGSTAVSSTAAELNLLDGVSGLVQADFTKLAAVDSTAAELNIIDGDTSASSVTVADADRVVFNDGGTMKQVAVTDLAAYFDDEITAMPNLVTTAATTVGALNSGSITSGFGTIDTGSSNITTTGVGAFGSLNISGNIDIDGTTNLDTVDIDGPVQLDSTLTIGANDQGYDVILYGDTASANMTWDTSVDDLIFNGAARIVVPDGQLVLGSTAVTSTAAELNLLDGVSGLVQADLTKLAAVDATAAELNIMDGGTSATSTTIADADRFVLNDNGTMVQVAGSDVKTYIGGVSTLAGLTDVSMDISGLTNGLIIQTENDGSAPNTGTLNNASGILGIGENVFNALTSGDDSLALGNNALATMTTGSANIAIGNNTNDLATTENYNIAIGYNAMTSDINGAEFNVAIGSGAHYSLTTGDANVAIGHQAAYSQTTGGANVIIGSDAGRDLTEGTDCTLIGYDAGYHGNATTTGTSITILGAKSHASGATNVRQIVLGYNVTGAANDSLTFGDASTDCRINFGQTSITAPSDIRMKENIETATAGLDFINDLRPVTYNWKQEKDIPVELNAHVEGSTKRYNNDKLNHGFIAQEVKEVIDNHPEIKDGFNMWNEDDADGRQRIGETALVPVLVTAMQEMSAKIDTLQNEINNLKGE